MNHWFRLPLAVPSALICLLALVSVSLLASAEEEKSEDWKVDAPPGEFHEIDLDLRTGTWLSLDVSPDGKWIIFDLLGDIYRIPMSGGNARSITSGLAWDYQPRFSPDGTLIAFTSDRAGGDNIWIMDADGSNPRQLTKEEFRLLNNPTWDPSGQYIVARKHFTTRRSLGTGELWLYDLRGGDGVQLVKKPSEQYQKELGEPMFSPDGRYLYYTQSSTSGDRFLYAEDSNRELFQIRRYDMQTRDIVGLVRGPGGAVRPTPSPDGKRLAFVRREMGESALFVRDLRTGQETALVEDLDHDMQETWGVQGLYPNMDWTPDSSSVVYWSGGIFHRVEVATKTVTDINFHVSDTRTAVKPPRATIDVAPDEVDLKMLRFAAVSPNRKQVVFEALGHLWIRNLPQGTAEPLTKEERAFELYPTWSPDGKFLAFVCWSDAELGSIRIYEFASKQSRTVTQEPGHYQQPRFSPDGSKLVYQRNTGGYLTSGLWSVDPGIYELSLANDTARRVLDHGRDPHYSADGTRIYYTNDGGDKHELRSVNLDGHDERTHASSEYARRFEISPGGDYLAFRENYHIYVVSMPPSGEVILSPTTTSIPLRRATKTGGQFMNWTNTERLSWLVGPTLHSIDVGERLSQEGKTPESDKTSTLANLAFTIASDRPTTTIAFTGARIVTMDAGRRVIDDGVIIVNGNRIEAVGAVGDVRIPRDATRVALAGKTVIPGFIDAHAHGAQAADGVIPQQNWAALAHLAFGVTTIHDPSNSASDIFAASEYQRAGRILGPRMFSTGEILYGARSEYQARIKTLDDARDHVRRLKAQGAVSVKNYNQPRREQRQMVVAAAREEGLNVVAEGGSLYHMDMSIIADGNTGLEHNLPPEYFYDDVLQFWAASGVGYTPTLIVTYGGLSGERWFYQQDDVWLDPILSKFVPPHVLQPRAVRRVMAPEEDYDHLLHAAAQAKKLMKLGVLVNMGAHGQREGLGSHWEIWAFAMGGMSPMEALATATTLPAQHLGFANDLGSIEKGKLADLVVLGANPLDDIRNTHAIEKVVLNGRVYLVPSLNEVYSGNRELAPFYWEE